MSILNKSEVKQFFKDGRQKTFYDELNLNNQSIIFILGAYKGLVIDIMNKKYGCQIYGFEPIKRFYDICVANFINNNNIHIYNYGLGRDTTKIDLYINGDATSEFLTNGIKEECQIINYIDFLNKESIDKIDVLEINIEGGEYDLVAYLIETDIISKINMIFIQYHYPSDENIAKIEKYHIEMNKTHRLIYNYSFCWERWVKK